MPTFEGRPSPHRWNEIRRIPLHPWVRSLQDYETGVQQGLLDASAYLKSIDTLQLLGVRDISYVHQLAFGRVHPFAGGFRKPSEFVTVSGYVCAEAPRIERELELTLMQFREVLGPHPELQHPHQLLGAVALLHVRFERVHPFRDGNGRTGRAILAAQMERLLGKLPALADQASYRAAIRASGKGELGPFVTFLAAEAHLEPFTGSWLSPFRMAPRVFDEGEPISPSLAADLDWSRIVR